jgi:hypothetical protein
MPLPEGFALMPFERNWPSPDAAHLTSGERRPQETPASYGEKVERCGCGWGIGLKPAVG